MLIIIMEKNKTVTKKELKFRSSSSKAIVDRNAASGIAFEIQIRVFDSKADNPNKLIDINRVLLLY